VIKRIKLPFAIMQSSPRDGASRQRSCTPRLTLAIKLWRIYGTEVLVNSVLGNTEQKAKGFIVELCLWTASATKLRVECTGS
jgi:hypothetical protein